MLLTRSFISHNSIACLFPAVYFNRSPGAFTQRTPSVWMCRLRPNRPSALPTSRLRVVKVLPDVPLTQPTSEYLPKAPLLVQTAPLKGCLSLYPGMRSEFQIRIRVRINIRYLLKRFSLSFSLPL